MSRPEAVNEDIPAKFVAAQTATKRAAAQSPAPSYSPHKRNWVNHSDLYEVKESSASQMPFPLNSAA